MLKLKIIKESGDVLYSLEIVHYGRIVAADVKDPVSGATVI